MCNSALINRCNGAGALAGNATLSKGAFSETHEWHTNIVDIEKELRHYRPQVEGKFVLCNCDDTYESNFFKCLAMNFNNLQFEKLIATPFVGSSIADSQLPLFEAAGVCDAEPTMAAHKAEIFEVVDRNDDGAIGLLDVEHTTPTL